MAGNFEYTLTPQGQALRDMYTPAARMSTGGAYNFDVNSLKGSGKTAVYGNGMDQVAAGSTPMGEDNYIPITGANGEALQAQKAGDNWIVYPMIDMGGTGFSGQKLTKLNGVPYDVYGPDGAHIATKQFEGFKDDKIGDALGVASIFAMAGGAAAAGLGAGAGTGAAAGTAAGGSGAFLGEGVAAGIGPWDAALAASPSWAAPAAAATTGAGFVGEGAASGVPAWDAALSGAAPAGAGAGGLTGLNAVDLTGTGLPLDSTGSVIGSQAGGGTLSNAAIESIINGSSAAGSSLLQQLTAKLGASGAQSLLNGALNGAPSALTTLTGLLGPAASIIGGGLAANAAGNAADSQLQAQREAAALSEPWRQKGEAALNRMAEVIGIGGDTNAPDYNSLNKPYTADSLYADPSYQFRKDEGMKGVTSAYASKGNFLSGGALKGLDRYNQDYASTEYGKGFDRDRATKTDSFNRLASVAGTGQTAANTMGTYASNAGDAAAAGTVGTANAWTDAINGAFKTWQANQSNSQMQPYYNALTQRLLQP